MTESFAVIERGSANVGICEIGSVWLLGGVAGKISRSQLQGEVAR